MKVCAYQRKDSPYIWFKWTHPVSRKQVFKSSKVKKTDPDQARRIAKKINLIEGQLLSATPESDGEDFNLWVIPFLKQRHQANPGTLHKNTNAWNWLAGYLRHIGVTIPRELTRSQVLGYIDWRCGQMKLKSKRYPLRNTALYDLRILGKIMQEAMDRGYCEKNVARRLGIDRDDVKEKAEISEEEEAKILRALRGQPDWMRASFIIAIQTGLRFRETRLEFARQVDFANRTFTLPSPKGGKRKAFSCPLPTALIDMLKEIQGAGKSHTWEAPKGKGTRPISMQWRDFFDGLNMRHLSFHCTRATYITRLIRKGVPEAVVMKLVNHASKEISRIYQKLNVDDVRKWVD